MVTEENVEFTVTASIDATLSTGTPGAKFGLTAVEAQCRSHGCAPR
jgi:hypothetical protein